MQTIKYTSTPTQTWQGSPRALTFDPAEIAKKLKQTDQPCYLVRDFRGRIGIAQAGTISSESKGLELLAYAPPFTAEQLGDPTFREFYGTKYAYKTGAMANGIASAELVIAMGKAGLIGSFGAAGLVPQRVQENVERIQAELNQGEAYAANLIHSPTEVALEAGAVDRFLRLGVKVVEASAFLDLTLHIVRYRAAGLSKDAEGNLQIENKVIAKVSRREVAAKFMQPAPQAMLDQLVQQGHITREQAELARQIPVADDITVEADSGGHTDNRPLVALLPSVILLRDEIQQKYNYSTPIRIGAAGGIATPEAALGAFMMGAAYIVTGSVNQACIEAGTSDHVKKLLAQVSMTDVMMAPASDMFEMGVELQVLKRGTMFAPRAKKLYEYYVQHDSIDDIPTAERQKLEKSTFQRPLEEVWQDCIAFFNERDPEQIERAKDNPKRKMALIFRWYLGLSSNWANGGTAGRQLDYQIWCGPAMGAFNDWVRGTYLEQAENRQAADVAEQIMQGAAYLWRVQNLRAQGVELPVEMRQAIPEKGTSMHKMEQQKLVIPV